MICPGCAQNVHPIGDMVVVPRCEACNEIVAGVNPEAIEGRYPCGACGHVGYIKPTREFRDRCPLASCRATFPKQEAVAEIAPAREANDNASKRQPPKPAPLAKADRSAPADAIVGVRERYAYVQERVKELRCFEKEERQLARMLAVIDADDLAAE